jgi:hypothetical protein
MMDSGASPRHRIDASKTLDAFAANGPQAVPASERILIQINLGADVEYYSKSRAIDPHDADPNIDTTTLAIVAAKNRSGSDNDGGHI